MDLNPHLTDKSKPTVISDIFIDPTGQHCIVSTCLKSDGKSKEFNEDFISRVGHENFYINRMVHKLNKLKGLVISAVGWNHASMSSKNDSIPNTPMGNILIGTTDGRIFETQLQPDDRFLVSKELFLKQICELPDNLSHGNFSSSNLSDKQKEPICAINCFKISTYGSRSPDPLICILVATSNFLYHFIGKVGLSSITSDSPYLYQIIQNPSNRLHKEMPGYIPASQFSLFYPSQGSSVCQTPSSFGWLTSECFTKILFFISNYFFRTWNFIQ